MQLTVIGCWGGYPKANEASTGYLLEHKGFKLLLDCGSGVLSKLQQHTAPMDLDAVLISHYHADHVADIGVLQYAIQIQNLVTGGDKNLPIYGHTLDPDGFAKLTWKGATTGVAYEKGQELRIGPFSIAMLETIHPVPCFAFRIEADGEVFAYTADSAYKEEFADLAKGADLFLCECNFYEHMDGKAAGHMNSREAGTLAEKAGVKELMLTHLPHFGDVEQLAEEAKKYFDGPVQLAKSGLIWKKD